MLKILSIVGARPQFIKSAALSKAIAEFNKKQPKPAIKQILLHTGQHYDVNMSDIFFKELKLKKPNYNLGISKGSHGEQTGKMLVRIENILENANSDLVVVFGDTNSTLAGALAAKKLHIPVAHIEAGLRSYDMNMPEEVNRIVVDRISDILFCPSEHARINLANEGISSSKNINFQKVSVVGDIMYDSLKIFEKLSERKSKILDRLNLKANKYYLATVHRAKNTDNKDRLLKMIVILNKIADTSFPVIFSIHPRTKKAIASFRRISFSRNLRIIEPVSYLDMISLEKNAKFILTDSGGVQKEAFFLKTPCITLREKTEWVETEKLGWNSVLGLNKSRILKTVDSFKVNQTKCDNPYGNGMASEKIVKIIYLAMKDAKS